MKTTVLLNFYFWQTFSCKKRETVNWQLLFVSMFICIICYLKAWEKVKNWNWKSSSLYWYIWRQVYYILFCFLKRRKTNFKFIISELSRRVSFPRKSFWKCFKSNAFIKSTCYIPWLGIMFSTLSWLQLGKFTNKKFSFSKIALIQPFINE